MVEEKLPNSEQETN